jgi:16S rRNA (uracil1498-N3)-methyltransferase
VVVRRLITALDGVSVGATRALDDEAAHYARDVLRVRVGEPLELFDGEGGFAAVTVARIERRSLEVIVDALEQVPPPPGPAITLLAGVSKGEKLETTLRMATELGVRRFVPIQAERSVRALDGEGRALERLRAVADDAIRVARRFHRPALDPPTTLEAWLSRPRAARALVFAGTAAIPLRAALAGPAPDTVELLVGPEGGLTEAELERAARAGFVPTSLGPHTLRTETAGVAVVAAVSFLLTPEPTVDRAASPSG